MEIASQPNALPIAAPIKRATRKERWAWYFYDFGNSAYAAVVLLAVYSAYFKGTVVGGARGSSLWGLSVGIAMLVVAITSPVLGALADFSASKKKVLFFFTTMSVIFTASLFFVQKGDVMIGMIFFILAEIGYRNAQVFYNALLPEIAGKDEIGRISGNGWAIGSAGGIVCLLIVLALIMFVGGPLMIRISFLITAVFYALSTLPVFLYIKERARPEAMPAGETYVTYSFKRLWNTIKVARKDKEFSKFLLSFLIFNHGIIITLDFAAIIGAVLFGMKQTQLIIFMMIVQITSVIGAFLFGRLTQKIGGKKVLLISLFLMVLTVSCLFWVNSLFIFYVIGAGAGFALTGVQSVSRTMVGQYSPVEYSAEYFSLFSTAGLVE
ncbi:MAG: MFS transporter, partial [Anaerolineaceae bacterium]|nr:MFS transporter [Anaerolineaceae bacterium]